MALVEQALTVTEKLECYIVYDDAVVLYEIEDMGELAQAHPIVRVGTRWRSGAARTSAMPYTFQLRRGSNIDLGFTEVRGALAVAQDASERNVNQNPPSRRLDTLDLRVDFFPTNL